MFKKMVSSPHTHSGKLTARIMLWVIAAMLPALLTQIYYFGMGVLVQSALAISFALVLEFIVTKLRNKPNLVYISDFSVVLTALILTMAIPPYATLLGDFNWYAFRCYSRQTRLRRLGTKSV